MLVTALAANAGDAGPGRRRAAPAKAPTELPSRDRQWPAAAAVTVRLSLTVGEGPLVTVRSVTGGCGARRRETPGLSELHSA